MTTIFTDRKDATIDQICKSIGYAGRKIRIRLTDKVSITGTYWSEGCKSDYYAVNLATNQLVDLPSFNPPQFGGPKHDPEVTLLDNMAVCELSSRAGKSDLTINISPKNAAPLLPKSIELNYEERKVLECTRTYKSSYAGIRDYRFYQSGMVREAWDAAKASLISKGLLNKAGAITNDGRNAIPR